jgi:NAD(P)-dependent dehydrogenase (short-subunit alcohol dehydrogenase family)
LDLKLNNKVAIVTGGGTGIGKAIAEVLAGEGAHIAICGRRQAVLDEAARELAEKTGRRILPVRADTTDWPSLQNLAKITEEALGGIHILVNCAATPSGVVRNELEFADDQALLADMNTKTFGYFRASKAVVACMKRQNYGRIINIGGLTARATESLSGMRNVAISHMTKTLSDQLGPFGITVNQIHPGVVQTQHIEELFTERATKEGRTYEDVKREWCAETPIRRILQPEEIGYLVAFLASPLGGGLTGESIAFDGGLSRGIYV